MRLKLVDREPEPEPESGSARDVKRVRIYGGGPPSTWPVAAWDVDANELRDLAGLAADKWDRISARLRPDAEILERDHKSARTWKVAEPATLALIMGRAGMLRRRGDRP